jgi:hypothetical protein
MIDVVLRISLEDGVIPELLFEINSPGLIVHVALDRPRGKLS